MVLAPTTLSGPSAELRSDRVQSGCKKRLQAVGLRPINNVVDVTNYVLLETGQPLHAFDAQKIKGPSIIVRNATENESITTLDEVKRTLQSDMLVIADAERPLVVAGVMGSVDAEVDDNTTDLVLESAWFRPGSVRSTARRLGLYSDSSQRFSRDVDPAGVEYAARRAIDLIIETAGGELAPTYVSVGSAPVVTERFPSNIPLWNRPVVFRFLRTIW